MKIRDIYRGPFYKIVQKYLLSDNVESAYVQLEDYYSQDIVNQMILWR